LKLYEGKISTMFEQATTDIHGPLKRSMAMTISFAGQAAVLTTAALVSFLHTDSLPDGLRVMGVVAPPGRSSPPTQLKPHAVTGVTVVKAPWRPFTQPPAIPSRIEMDGAAGASIPSFDGAAIDAGVIGAFGPAGRGLLPIDLPHPVPPPPKPAAEKKAATATVSAPVAISRGVQAAKLIRQVNPPYPPLAKQARISGTVRLTAIIGRDGAIERLQLISGHPLLAPAALEAVKQWVYRPTLLNEVPVEVITQIDVNFTLSQ
jgi:protein TonB